jgi:hypothetical protein
MSPTMLAYLLAAERSMQRDVGFCRRWYRNTGMTRAQVAYYGNRTNWPDARQLVRTNGIGPYWTGF